VGLGVSIRTPFLCSEEAGMLSIQMAATATKAMTNGFTVAAAEEGW